ncbi:MAG: hypothetical protein LUQ11_04815 [Methylococcaceae bacterium]|nr:hypothetical protein [Methylococcaceae bacterium]
MKSGRDHIHAIWTLPPDDADYSKRWGAIKKQFTESWLALGGEEKKTERLLGLFNSLSTVTANALYLIGLILCFRASWSLDGTGEGHCVTF